MAELRRDALRAAIGGGVAAAAALGFANQAAHPGPWDVRLLCALLGALGVAAALRLSGGRWSGAAWASSGRSLAALLAALLPLAARMDGRALWGGGVWVACVGTVAALAGLAAGGGPPPRLRAAWLVALAGTLAGATAASFHPATAAWAGVVAAWAVGAAWIRRGGGASRPLVVV